MQAVCSEHNVEYNKWGQCPDCHKIHKKRYESSEKGKAQLQRRRERYFSTDKGKAVRREAGKRLRSTTEGKRKRCARSCVYQAIRDNNLIKQPCLICGNIKSEAHHAWGYAKEHTFHVIFLCKKHHYQADHDPVFNEELKSKAPVV